MNSPVFMRPEFALMRLLNYD